MKLAIVVLAMGMCVCNKKAPGIGDDAWAWSPPVACPTMCSVWHLEYAAPIVDAKSIARLANPHDGKGPAGRILANDPNDPKTVVVVFHDGCEIAEGTVTFETK